MMDNLGQPMISDIVKFIGDHFCDPCNAVICAGCPIVYILNKEALDLGFVTPAPTSADDNARYYGQADAV
jgi:hypothetical protein